MGTGKRLDRLLANLGYGSRREVAAMVQRGRITLDGVAVADSDGRIALTPDLPARMMVDGTPLDPLPGLVVMLNKPLGVTCSHRESGGVIYDLLPRRWRRRDPPLSSIGRLDRETTGLLLLTDDGPLLHRYASPKQLVPKRYLATLARPLRGDEAAVFGSGTLMLDGEDKPLLPAELAIICPVSAQVTIREGRYHQVRRMFAAVGNHVEALHRETVGGLAMAGDLLPGDFRTLDPAEIARVVW